MAKLQYMDELANTIRNKNKRVNIKSDDAYIESTILTQVEQAISTYLSNSKPNEDIPPGGVLHIEIKQAYVDNFLSLLENSSLTDTLTVRQIKPTIFELKLKDLNLFI